MEKTPRPTTYIAHLVTPPHNWSHSITLRVTSIQAHSLRAAELIVMIQNPGSHIISIYRAPK